MPTAKQIAARAKFAAMVKGKSASKSSKPAAKAATKKGR